MLLKLKNVKKNYKINKNEVQEVLKDINLTLKSGEFVCIYGESGSGKSTLMNIIGGLDDDYIGTVTINKNDIKKIDKDNYRRDKIGFVFHAHYPFNIFYSQFFWYFLYMTFWFLVIYVLFIIVEHIFEFYPILNL